MFQYFKMLIILCGKIPEIYTYGESEIIFRFTSEIENKKKKKKLDTFNFS